MPYPPPGQFPPGYPPGYPPGPYAAVPVPPAPRTSPALSGARLLAWTGGAVTLLGVVLLLVLASSRDWFTPPARIAAGALLAAALVGLGFRLHRKESSRAGALALVGTGFATAYLVVAAATAVYDYLAPVPALLVALVVAGGGLGVADRWRTQLLASASTVGAVVLAPVLADGWLLVALALALQVAALAVVLRRRWPVLMLVAAAGPLLYGVVVIGVEGFGGPVDVVVVVAVALAVLAAALGTAGVAARSLPVAPVATLVGAAAVPSLVGAGVLDGWDGGALALGAALALAGLAFALRGLGDAGRPIRLVAAAAASVALLDATAVALGGAALTLVLLGEAVVAAVLAGVLRSRFALVVSMVFGTFGTLAALGRDAPLAALVRFPALPYVDDGVAQVGALVTGVAVAVLVLGLAAALLIAGGRLGWIRPDAGSALLWVPIGLTGLYGAAGIVIPLALLVSADRAGFTAGHALVTVSWTVAALVLLARGISRPALRIAGLVLVAAAVAKLVLFDLVALDGLARVGAFLGAGLVLLAAGTRYARMVAESESGPVAPPPPPPG